MKAEKILCSVLLLASFFSIGAQVKNNPELIYGDHWAYEAFYQVATDAGLAVSADIAPVSAGELKYHLAKVDVSRLSEAGLKAYERLYSFLYGEADSTEALRLGWNVELTGETYYKTDDSIDWSFYKYMEGYPLNIPLTIGFSDCVSMNTSLFLGKNIPYSADSGSFTNIPLSDSDLDFLFPNKASASTGYYSDGWGLNLQIGRSDVTMGRTFKGSVVYNSTFETNAYVMGSIWAGRLKINSLFAEIDVKRYMAMHEIQVNILPNLTFGISEGQLTLGQPELRFANPLIIFHNFFAGDDYTRNKGLSSQEKYDRDDCSYMGVFIDYVPVENVRLYFLYSQDEMQLQYELVTGGYAQLLPNAFGIQTGTEAWFNGSNGSIWKLNAEGIYTSPFLYVKQKPECSLLRQRFDKMYSYLGYGSETIDSWMGTPYGPDCMGGDIYLKYEQPEKWSVSLEYSMVMHGENDWTMFNKKAEAKNGPDAYKGEEIYNYYPSVRYYITETGTFEENRDLARSNWLTGTIETLHTLSLGASTYCSRNLKVSGKASYMLDFNCEHVSGNFQHGLELLLAVSYNVF